MLPADSALANVLEQIRNASRDQIMLFAKRPLFRLEPSEADGLPFVQQMTHILITSGDLEISFKSHFMLVNAVRLTCGKLGVATASNAQGIDFMKEFCNIVAGKTKAMLENAGLTAAQSLPISIQGYNEIFYPSVEMNFARAAWKLTDDDDTISCSAVVAVRKPAQLEALTRLVYRDESRDDIGVVDLF